MKYLLGISDAKNYDGSWTEWGNLVGASIETGAALTRTTGAAKEQAEDRALERARELLAPTRRRQV